MLAGFPGGDEYDDYAGAGAGRSAGGDAQFGGGGLKEKGYEL